MCSEVKAIRKSVIARFKIDGVHCWNTCDIPEVAYLKDPHRHLFHITATCVVDHSDRDVEFIKLSHDIKQYLTNKYYSETLRCCDFGGMSCEMIAEEVLNQFNLAQVEVNEDGEGGAVLDCVFVGDT